MKFARVNIIVVCFLLLQKTACSQDLFTGKITFDPELKDSFSFLKQWDYPWHITKDDNGKFSSAVYDKVRSKDTAHLLYTANCTTSVQGGYTIHYCYTSMNADTVKLIFTDGLPAYANEFIIFIMGDSFYFLPRVYYTAQSMVEKLTYKVDTGSLVLQHTKFQSGKKIVGYANFEFTEIAPNTANNTSREKKYYFVGYFSTVLKLRDKNYP